ncbi:MAG: hypothetical protein HYX97_06670 [Chloroflexi bacterium]|nr:hypothetical protein [Chloroflexota bacterium]
MERAVTHYLEQVRAELRLPPGEERHIIGEVCLHLEDEVRDLMLGGLGRHEAAAVARQRLGHPKALGRRLYAAHHRGSWRQALYAAGPHLVLALIISWQLQPQFLAIAGFLAFTTMFTLVGLWKGKPAWFYAWAGYALAAPLAAGAIAVSTLMRAASSFLSGQHPPLHPLAYAGLLIYLAVLAGLLSRIAVRVVRRDWTLASLMVVPLPLLIWLLLSLQSSAKDAVFALPDFPLSPASSAVSLLALAGVAVGFVRFRQRLVKVWMLLTIAPAFVLIGLGDGSTASVAGAFALAFLSLALLLSPALLDHKARDVTNEVERWGDIVHYSGHAER